MRPFIIDSIMARCSGVIFFIASCIWAIAVDIWPPSRSTSALVISEYVLRS